jgi:phosphoglycolate phosphatase
MLELVIFDADGVLFDSTESNTAYYNAIYAAIGEPPMDLDEQRAGVFMSAMQVFAMRAGGDRDRIERMRAVARTMDAAPFFALLRPPLELRSFLTSLKRRYRLGLATNRSATIPALIDHLGLADIFDAVASARDPVRPKPAPDIIALCLDRAGVRASRAVYVGDSDTDRIAAEAAGTHFIGLGPRVSYRSEHNHGPNHQPNRPPNHLPGHLIDALAELPAALDHIFGFLG